MLKGIGKETDGLYLLTIKTYKSTCIIVVSAIKAHVSHKENEDISLWHKRMSHPFGNSMKLLFGYNLDIYKSVLFDCVVCPLTQQTRQSLHPNTSTSFKSFDLLHLDVWEPYHAKCFDENKNFLDCGR